MKLVVVSIDLNYSVDMKQHSVTVRNMDVFPLHVTLDDLWYFWLNISAIKYKYGLSHRK